MSLNNYNRTFFLLYSNGDTFYFNVNVKERKISCLEFQKMYGATTNQVLPTATELEIVNNSFNLKNAEGKVLYSLEKYKEENSRRALFYQRQSTEQPTIERIYMDEDIRQVLLGLEMIKYDPGSSNIPGLLYEPVEEVRSYARIRTSNNK